MIATWQHRRKAVADAAAASAQETAALTSDSSRYMDKAFKIWSLLRLFYQELVKIDAGMSLKLVGNL